MNHFYLSLLFILHPVTLPLKLLYLLLIQNMILRKMKILSEVDGSKKNDR